MPLPQDSERDAEPLNRILEAIDSLAAVVIGIEAKLDTLIDALAEEPESDEAAFDLEGNRLPPDRPEHEPL